MLRGGRRPDNTRRSGGLEANRAWLPGIREERCLAGTALDVLGRPLAGRRRLALAAFLLVGPRVGLEIVALQVLLDVALPGLGEAP